MIDDLLFPPIQENETKTDDEFFIPKEKLDRCLAVLEDVQDINIYYYLATKNFYLQDKTFQEEILYLLLLKLWYGGKKGKWIKSIILDKSKVVGVGGFFAYAIFKKDNEKKEFLCWISDAVGKALEKEMKNA